MSPGIACLTNTDTGGRIIVDLHALAANWCFLRDTVGPDCEVASVVKADGYGLGSGPVARALAAAGCRWFFVALPHEGVALAQALGGNFPDVRIAVLSGPLPAGAGISGRPALSAPLVPVLNSLDQLTAWRSLAQGATAMLHIDTGMSRLGFSAAEARRLIDEPALLDGVELAAVISHLACADQPDHPLNARQLAAFESVARGFAHAPCSLAASYGVFLGSAFHYDMVRVGAALYGINPTPGRPNPMRPVVTVQARVIQIRDIQAGESVGYGATWTAERASRVATIAVGYADGLPRAAGNSVRCWAGEQDMPVIGRVSMDLMTLDASGVPAESLAVGDYVDLVGPHYDLDAFARDCGTVAYEVLTRLGTRLPRVYQTAAH